MFPLRKISKKSHIKIENDKSFRCKLLISIPHLLMRCDMNSFFWQEGLYACVDYIL